MKEPTYYVAIFGNPDPPEKDTVESGRYHLGIRGTDIPGERGDILLLYCNGSYAAHFMSVPGIGVILTKHKESINYRYLPLSKPIPKDHIIRSFTDEDKKKFSNIRFDNFWMFKISRESYCNATKNFSIKLP
jgi:hypothetical protein